MTAACAGLAVCSRAAFTDNGGQFDELQRNIVGLIEGSFEFADAGLLLE
jgi:hypothetical protein